MRVEKTILGIKLVGSSGPRYSHEEFRQRGDAIYSKIKDKVKPGNNGKFLAIDIETGDYEVNEDEMKAVDALYDRIDDPQVTCYRIGYRTTHSLGGGLIPEIDS